MVAISDARNPVYAQLGDKDLLALVRSRGHARLAADWRFAAPLPELERRGLDLRAGFQDLEHFSAREGGASQHVVSRVRNLEAKLGVYPKLWSLMDEGRVGWSKLEVIADMVTPETEHEWRWKVLNLSKRALEDHVRQRKHGPAATSQPSRSEPVSDWPGSGPADIMVPSARQRAATDLTLPSSAPTGLSNRRAGARRTTAWIRRRGRGKPPT